MSRSSLFVSNLIVALSFTAASVAVLPAQAIGQTVSDRTLSDVKVNNVGACTALTINFNIRVQMLSFFPDGNGRELHVRVRPLDIARANASRESLRTPVTVPALRSIEYEGDNPAGPILSLFFTQDMHFEVEPGGQQQGITVRIADPAAGSCATGAASGRVVAGPGQGAPAMAIPSGLYVVNAISQPDALPALSPAQSAVIDGQVAYETVIEQNSQEWHRLRIGFFESREAAEAARTRLETQFPGAWVVKVSAEERQQGVSSRLATGGTPAATTGAATTPTTAASAADITETARLTADAEVAIRDGNNDRAVQLLTNALALPENAGTARALELLGLTRERKGQMAHAQAEYEEYLRRYPQGDAADRVRQRLAAVSGTGSGGATTPALRAASGNVAAGTSWAWGVRGSFSQFYFRDQSKTRIPETSANLGSEVDSSVNLNQLLTSADVTITGGNDRRQLQLRTSGSYTQNFGTSSSVTTINNGSNSTTISSRPGGGVKALTAAYLDYTDRDLDTQVRIGRQTRNSAGVLGRFDGALIGWQAQPKLRINAVVGFPVLSSRQMSVLSDRLFYGLSVDVGAKQSPLQTTFYLFDQHSAGGFVDRRSVGFEGRYLKSHFNAYTIIDYDVKFSRLNLGLLSMSYNFPDNSNLSLTADYRQSPLLTTNNALIGQILTATMTPVTDLRELRPFFTDDQIYQLAVDRTLIAKSMTVSYSRPLTKKLQANVDITVTNTGGTPATLASAGTEAVGALPASGTEYYYGTQLIGSGMLWSNDIYILSGRYADTQRSRTWTADFNARVPVTNRFRLSPRLRYGFRGDKIADNTFRQFQPTMRFNYYPRRHSEIEIEFGGNFSRLHSVAGGAASDSKESGYTLSAGYRLDF